jgi:hypothetical protein
MNGGKVSKTNGTSGRSVMLGILEQTNEVQYIMDEYQGSSPTDFWNKFTDEKGKRMSFTAISQVLRDDREAAAIALAEKARKAFSRERFDELFSYTKGGRKYIKTKDVDIAKTYEKLLAKGITC